MYFLGTCLESVLLAGLGEVGFYFLKLWLGMVRALRHRMMLARVVFGPVVVGLVPREINYNADKSLRRGRGSF